MTLKPETIFKSKLTQLASLTIFVVSATWWVRGEFEDIKRGQRETAAQFNSIQTFIKQEAVTQSQAERYAAAFRWENRALDIMVPEPKRYQ